MDDKNNKSNRSREEIKRNRIIGLIFVIIFVVIYSFDSSGGGIIIVKKLLIMGVAALVGLMCFLDMKKKDDGYFSNLFLVVVCLCVLFFVGKNVILDIVQGPQTIVITNCYIEEDRYHFRHRYRTRYYLCGTSQEEGLIKFVVDYDEIKLINLEKDLEITYYDSSNDLISYKTVW